MLLLLYVSVVVSCLFLVALCFCVVFMSVEDAAGVSGLCDAVGAAVVAVMLPQHCRGFFWLLKVDHV